MKNALIIVIILAVILLVWKVMSDKKLGMPTNNSGASVSSRNIPTDEENKADSFYKTGSSVPPPVRPQ